MKNYEYFVSWTISGGIQCAYAYCNAESKTKAKQKIKNKIPYKLHSIEPNDCKLIQNEDEKLGDNVKLWYFTGAQLDNTQKEHTEIY